MLYLACYIAKNVENVLIIFIVTETEVSKGIVEASDSSNTCLWLKRTIEDIENKESSYVLSRYIGT